jgi:hypothetical protein
MRTAGLEGSRAVEQEDAHDGRCTCVQQVLSLDGSSCQQLSRQESRRRGLTLCTPGMGSRMECTSGTSIGQQMPAANSRVVSSAGDGPASTSSTAAAGGAACCSKPARSRAVPGGGRLHAWHGAAAGAVGVGQPPTTEKDPGSSSGGRACSLSHARCWQHCNPPVCQGGCGPMADDHGPRGAAVGAAAVADVVQLVFHLHGRQSKQSAVFTCDDVP